MTSEDSRSLRFLARVFPWCLVLMIGTSHGVWAEDTTWQAALSKLEGDAKLGTDEAFQKLKKRGEFNASVVAPAGVRALIGLPSVEADTEEFPTFSCEKDRLTIMYNVRITIPGKDLKLAQTLVSKTLTEQGLAETQEPFVTSLESNYQDALMSLTTAVPDAKAKPPAAGSAPKAAAPQYLSAARWLRQTGGTREEALVTVRKPDDSKLASQTKPMKKTSSANGLRIGVGFYVTAEFQGPKPTFVEFLAKCPLTKVVKLDRVGNIVGKLEFSWLYLHKNRQRGAPAVYSWMIRTTPKVREEFEEMLPELDFKREEKEIQHPESAGGWLEWGWRRSKDKAQVQIWSHANQPDFAQIYYHPPLEGAAIIRSK